jgi:GT2 family glycosyltransferase
MGVRKAAHIAVGGFDESIKYTVDQEYCWRLNLAGYQLAFVPDSLVEYRLRTSLRKTFRQYYRWGKGNIWIYRKHIGKGRAIDRIKFLFGGWRHLPSALLKLRHKSDVFELAAWLGKRVGEVDGCWRFLILK